MRLPRAGPMRVTGAPPGTLATSATPDARGTAPAQRAGLAWPVVPLVLTASYVAQPQVIPWIGAAIAGIGVLGAVALALDARAGWRAHAALASGTGALAFAVYARTLSPTTDVADSLELQVVAHLLRFAHPPGYPLYTLLGRGFTAIPIGDIAVRMNLLSAVAAGAAVAVLYLAAARLTGRAPAALAGALAFAFSPAFWSQAVITEVYALNVLIVTAVFAGLTWWAAPAPCVRRCDGRLALAAFAAGLGACHHVTIVFTAPLVAGTVLWRDPGLVRQPRRVARLAAAFGLGLTPLLYFFVRWPAVYGRPATVGEVLRYVTASDYGGLFDPAWPWRDASRLWMVAIDVVTQYGPIGIVLAAVGVAWLGRRSAGWAAAWAATWLAYAAFRAGYHAWDGWVVLLPAQAILGVWIAAGLAAVAGAAERAASRLAATAHAAGVALAWTAALAVPVAQLWSHGQELDRSAGWSGAAVGRAALAQPIPPGSAIVVDPQLGSALLYPQLIEGVRPDVAVAYLDTPSGRETLAAAATRAAPVFLLGVRPPAEGAYHLRSWGPLVELGQSPWQAPGTVPHPVGHPLPGGPAVTLVGFALDPGGGLVAGADVDVTLVWQRHAPGAGGGTPAPRAGDRVWLALTAAGGVPVALDAGEPVDGLFPFARWGPGEVVSDRRRLTVDVTAPPGRYDLVAAVAAPGEADDAVRTRATRIGTVTVGPAGSGLAARVGRPVVADWDGRVRLLGCDAPAAVRPGDPVEVVLYWQRLAHAGTADRDTAAAMTAAVGAGTAGRVEVGLPGTEGWPTGAVTATRHRFVVPPGVRAGRLPITLTVSAGGTRLPRRGLHGLIWRTSPLPIGSVTVRTGSPGLDAPRAFADGIRLVGLRADRVLTPGRRAWIGLTWEARQAPQGRYKLSVQLLGADHGRLVNVDRELLHGARPTNTWRQGDLVRDWFPLDVPADAPAGGHWLQVQLYDGTTREPLAVLDGDGRPADTRVLEGAYVAPTAVRPIANATDVGFGDALALRGYAITGGAPAEQGGDMHVVLRWAARRPLADDRTLFVHLVHVDSGGRASLVAQWDGQPFGGAFPTSLWPPGLPIDLPVTLAVPPERPPGRYRLAVGWYDLATGARLPRADGGDAFEIDVPERP